jgi:membrane-bound lytic murein transglycosylase A
MNRFLCVVLHGLIVATLVACTNPPARAPLEAVLPATTPAPLLTPDDSAALPAAIMQAKSRWAPVRWAELPGFKDDNLFEAWSAWLISCARPGPVFTKLCSEVRRLSIGSAEEQRAWLMSRLQPYRVEDGSGNPDGLLTAYFEPVFEAMRSASAGFNVPLYRPPGGLTQRRPWYTRQEIDTLSQARAALKGREIAFLSNPIDALILQIQGSGRLRITEADGTQVVVRLAYAASNEQPYKSVGRWLLDQGALRDASWPAIKAWAEHNPNRVNEMLWSNPRTVFFREERWSEQDIDLGPRGAQGVPLTPGRSIAVDPLSIPFGTPVWLASSGVSIKLQKMVLAQDTGSAIVGAVRADYFAGSGAAATELAGRLKQTLRLWVLWPK